MRYQKTVGIFEGDLAITQEEQVVAIEVPGKGRIWFPAKHLNHLNVLVGALRDFYLKYREEADTGEKGGSGQETEIIA